MRLRLWKWGLGVGVFALSALAGSTWLFMKSPPLSLHPEIESVQKLQVVDRHGIPLSVTWENRWNVSQTIALYEIPAFLQKAFVVAEDRRFYQHHGVDWLARIKALWQNIRARRFVRGASTITEQVVRMLHPRPRTIFSRWLEGWEAIRLEQRFSKADILEFYLNQVPYARQRRGVVPAAKLYFSRDLSTLHKAEMLALATLVRSPGRFDLKNGTSRIRPSIIRLSHALHRYGYISFEEFHTIINSSLKIFPSFSLPPSDHFLRYVQRLKNEKISYSHGQLHTTIDAALQEVAYAFLENRLRDLRDRYVTSGALIILDHQTDEVLAWVNAGNSDIDAALTPRQPGSTLKPFLYALALEKGWNAATLIDDTSLAQPIGAGLHAFRNYSGRHYGPLRLRIALGNSLNIPAIRTIDFVGTDNFLECLHRLGFSSLTRPSEYYGHGLALGNGEVTLFELVQAYAVLARHGVWRPVNTFQDTRGDDQAFSRVYSPEVSSLISNILADSDARRLEFGSHSLLNFSVETAVKTGTSSDYRDAWAIGFSHRYTAGVWMGNLTPRPMHGISGAIGPALVLRALFAELNHRTPSRPLWMSPKLIPLSICDDSGVQSYASCKKATEWFIDPYIPSKSRKLLEFENVSPKILPQEVLHFIQPTNGLHMAMDPRIPDTLESFTFILPHRHNIHRIEWIIDGNVSSTTYNGVRRFRWPLIRGKHKAMAKVWYNKDDAPIETSEVTFLVK